MGSQGRLAIVARQVTALQRRHPDLALVRRGPGRLVIAGLLGFVMSHKGRSVEDEFHIELRIPADYPNSPPDAYEVAGRLKDFDHLFKGGKLCLGAPVEVCMRFARRPCLLSFVEDLVVPFLFAFSYKAQYGEMPFGELEHGAKGILDYYNDLFGTSTERTMLLLAAFSDDHYHSARRPVMCPCGSGRRVTRCHGPKLDKLRSNQTAEATRDLIEHIVSSSQQVGKHKRPLLSRRLRRELRRAGKDDRQVEAARAREDQLRRVPREAKSRGGWCHPGR